MGMPGNQADTAAHSTAIPLGRPSAPPPVLARRRVSRKTQPGSS